MRWLNELIGKALVSIGLDVDSRLGGSIQFFTYDIIKIFVLLSLLIFGISYIQSYFPPGRTKQILGRFRGLTANLMGALLGTVTPFCSCSSIPIFMGFTNAGLPLGVTFSFLISSPLVDIGALILLMSVFGPKIAVAYVVVGIVLAVVSGTIIEKLRLDAYVVRFGRPKSVDATEIAEAELRKYDRLVYAKGQTFEIVHRVWLYVVIGVGIGALIHNWIPQTAIKMILGEKNPFSVLLAAIVGVPMYADIFGTIPISEALYAKGVGIGTILSFMMAVTALSLPSIIMLSKVIKPRLMGVFVGSVTAGIVIIGYTFNILSFLLR